MTRALVWTNALPTKEGVYRVYLNEPGAEDSFGCVCVVMRLGNDHATEPGKLALALTGVEGATLVEELAEEDHSTLYFYGPLSEPPEFSKLPLDVH